MLLTFLSGSALAVVGGEPNPPGANPQVAAIFRGTKQVCTGTLVSPTQVLTAAHCMDPLPGRVVLDRTRLGAHGGEEHRVSGGEVNAALDAGILTLATPSALPAARLAQDCASADEATLVGFGATDPTGTRRTDTLMRAAVHCEGAVCGAPGVDSCDGDSGGPVLIATPAGDDVIWAIVLASVDGQRGCGQGGRYLGAAALREAFPELSTEGCAARTPPELPALGPVEAPGELELPSVSSLGWRIARGPEQTQARVVGPRLVVDDSPSLRRDSLLLEASDGHFRRQVEVEIHRAPTPAPAENRGCAHGPMGPLGLLLLGALGVLSRARPSRR